MASQRSNQPNYDIHVHPSMRSALKAYMDTTRVPASTSQSKNGACAPHPQPASSAPADMLSGLLLEDAVLHNATKKIHNPYDKMFFLGTLAGVYNKVVPLRLLITNWIIIYIGNWCGCLVTAYFFGYLTDLFESEPYRSFLTSVTLSKLEEHGWGVLFLKAIPANPMVCMAVMLGLASRDSAGKIMALWFPVVMFVLCGFEHCVANMFFTSLGLMYGAPSTIRRQWFNQSASIPGNLIGGAIVIGLAEHLMNHWRSPIFRTQEGAGTLAAHDVESTRRARDVREVHPADLVARVRAILHAEHHPHPHHHAAAGPSELKNRGDGSSNKSEEGVCATGYGTTVVPEQAYHGGAHLSLVEGHEEALERRKAMRAQLGMKGFAAWFGHGSKSEKKADHSNNV
ncbi:putative transporter yrhG [Rhizoctonia solani AG-1 IB]|uniref:Putative transporter yrhG n=1 Tax=Thanatephorus cucumeris (strain AG1-IB / isolate 7/3/14) TaxID=1108050 RepID=M5BKW9_THACB|nr:putative transporter yrhG [Rhizoctonia solani AG-1 IB]